MTGKQYKVVLAIQESALNGHFHVGDVVSALKGRVSRTTVYKVLSILVDENLIACVGYGLYQVKGVEND